MNIFKTNILLLKHNIDLNGRREYLTQLLIHEPMNIVLFSLLFWVTQAQIFSWSDLALKYTYFVPASAFIAGVSAWDTEMICGIGEAFLLGTRGIFPARILITLAGCTMTTLIFAVLLFIGPLPKEHLITLFLMMLTFAVLGVSFGFRFGFATEKSINNYVHLSTWVLALGPGLFLQHKLFAFTVLFPGGLIESAGFGWEWVRLCLVSGLACWLAARSNRPRRMSFFQR